MATFTGFNTIDQYKKFTITDFELIKRDILNAFLIKSGEVPGRPDVGTTIWNLMFESQTPETAQEVRREIERVVAKDPRVYVANLEVYTEANGILVEMLVQVVGGTDAQSLAVFFDQITRRASYV
mgnify:CR=1 FL=1